MSRIRFNIPIRFWGDAAKSGTCSFPAEPSLKRLRAWTAILAAAAFALVAMLLLDGFGFPAVFAVLTTPAALFVLRQVRRYFILKIAVSNMWQGLAFYNSNGELVLYNGPFCAMLGLSPADVRCAKTHRAIIDLSFQAGNCDASSAEQAWRKDVAFIARRQAALAYIELPGNRSVAESHEPTADGGWIRTYADVTDRRQIEARMIHLAHHDGLTDLGNRVLFYQRLEQALENASEATPVALMFLDLDRFKSVNDTLGHAVGDQLLRLVADRLRRAVREEDAVARLGGDEFAIIQNGIRDASQVRELAERLVAAIGARYEIGGVPVSIGVSLGIVLAPSDGVASDRLSRNADIALYRAKSVGRGAYCFFADLDAALQQRRLVEAEVN
ncbi:MAG TPA: diguanylate cyclase [Roseiarcus sp.]|jgi:diguanylate cyclase (GGDEF)-like protein